MVMLYGTCEGKFGWLIVSFQDSSRKQWYVFEFEDSGELKIVPSGSVRI